jgi:hypothetical protein
MNSGIENGSASDNFDYYDRILIRIIKKHYPDLRNEKELKLLLCIGWTMKDLDWTVADAPEVEARMTLNLAWLEPDDHKPSHKEIRKKLRPYEYKDILSILISKNIVQEKMLLTTYGSPPNTLIKYDRFLAFTNEDMTHEILANTEALEYESKSFIDRLNNRDKSCQLMNR